MIRAVFLYFVILFNLANSLFPVNEDIRFKRITVEQGLSHSTVYSVVQDREGFIWVGTESGLNRYDGYDFKVFTHIPGDLKSLSSNFIRAIYEDSADTLWIGTWGGGLNKFDREIETFTCYKIDPGNENSLSSNQIRTICEDRSGVIWVGTSAGLYEFDREKETFISYTINFQNEEHQHHNIIYAICEDYIGILWIGTAAGLYKFDREGQEFIHFKDIPVQSIYKDRSEVMWIGDTTGINKFDREKGSFTRCEIGNSSGVYSIYEDKSGVLWIGTREGLIKFDRSEGKGTHYKKDPRDRNSLSHNYILSIYEDRSGVMWIGTYGGLNKFNREKKQFKHFRHISSTGNSLSNDYVWSLFEDSSGMLWIGTDNGLNRYDFQEELFTCYKHDPKNSKSLSDNSIYSIHEDRTGNLWVGTANGLDKFNRELESFTHYKREHGNSNSLSGNVILRIFADKSGLLWVGTFPGGLNSFDPREGKFTRYRHDSQTPGAISSNAITSIYEDSSGVLWVGTSAGLNKFDRKQEIFTCYKNDPLDSNSLSSDKIESIFEDSSGVMWLGIHGGLSRFDRETGHFISYTGKDGLPQVIYGILEDDHDSLWLSSNKGIYKFSPEDGTLKSYDVSDGLQDYHFNRGAFFKSKNGRMFFGGANGFNAFYPDDIEDNPYIPPVVITNFKVLNRDHKLEKSILQTRQLTLSYSDSFSFEFAALCFSEPGKNRYAYKLEGTHGDWIELGNKREITFNNLAPRGYTLKVKGCNDDGVWNEAGKSIIITIMPPFWQTWWFRLLGVIFMSVIIYSFYRFRVRNIEIQKTTLEAQVKERTEELERANRFKSDFLARMSHEIRTPLNAIIGFNDMMLDTDLSTEQLDYIQTAVRSGEVLLTLINDILDLSKVESGQLELEAIDFDPETTAFDVCELIRPKVGSSPVEILCRIGDKVPAYVKGDPGRFRQVLLNLMSNAAKFTRAGEIELTLDVLDERKTAMTLHTTVRDSGIGIPKEKTADIFEYFQQVSGSTAREYGGSGLGLTISKQLAKLMGGDIQVESEFGRGSAFHFFAVMEKAGRKVKKLVQPVSLQGKRVLIVDDNKHNLEILSHQLKIEGMNVVMLDRGTDVLAALKAANREGNPFDTCILDIDMPGINGFETARIIRSSKSPSPHLPLLALTSISGQSSEMREAGFDLFSPKPVRRGKLVEMLQQLLGERKLEEKVPAKEAAAVEHSTVDEDRPHIRILLVEDDPINQKMAKYLLTRAGYQVEVANNGREALSTYCSDPAKFNLILMDVQMPEMDGLEAAGTMRKQGFVHVPIIAMTAQAMKGDREKCLQAGMNDYIAKPIKRDVIFAMVKKWTS